ncbi:MAG: winged helix-turn-helix domain-containing protein [Myxococcales bacterium]|nr:winged helix-turn-helix domain-containing protein [Myxococcales bacterium]
MVHPTSSREPSNLALLSPHAHVLRLLIRDPRARQSEVAKQLGITERTAGRLLQDLRAAGYITAVRGGSRRNSYTVCLNQPLRHALERSSTIGQVMRGLASLEGPRPGE